MVEKEEKGLGSKSLDWAERLVQETQECDPPITSNLLEAEGEGKKKKKTKADDNHSRQCFWASLCPAPCYVLYRDYHTLNPDNKIKWLLLFPPLFR